jgi:hypothetical protein
MIYVGWFAFDVGCGGMGTIILHQYIKIKLN